MRFVQSAGIRQRYRADFRGPHRVQFDRRWHLRNSVQPVGLDPTTHDDLCSYGFVGFVFGNGIRRKKRAKVCV